MWKKGMPRGLCVIKKRITYCLKWFGSFVQGLASWMARRAAGSHRYRLSMSADSAPLISFSNSQRCSAWSPIWSKDFLSTSKAAQKLFNWSEYWIKCYAELNFEIALFAFVHCVWRTLPPLLQVRLGVCRTKVMSINAFSVDWALAYILLGSYKKL